MDDSETAMHATPGAASYAAGCFGFLPLQTADLPMLHGWWEEETDPGVRGIDQSIADAAQLGQGLGTAMVKAFVAKLFTDPQVTRIQADPDPRNARAIRGYEKAGFHAVGEVRTPDGWLC